MKKITKYGKSSEALLNLKSSFFNENNRHVKKQTDIASIYLDQDLRKSCKNCDSKLNISSDSDFVKSKIKYFICDTCSHLNGAYEDSIEFCKEIYTKDDGKKYSDNFKPIIDSLQLQLDKKKFGSEVHVLFKKK